LSRFIEPLSSAGGQWGAVQQGGGGALRTAEEDDIVQRDVHQIIGVLALELQVLQRRIDVLGELARLGLVLLGVVREGKIFVLQFLDDVQELCRRLWLRSVPVS